ncbi:General stress protein 17o [Chromobacterium violaceum]|uniref:General stress protein 17o n=1 Tax=Chromobacterium violaceum TaxID=536 RepID=A0A3S4LIM9_CHRVL|nr:General stress protein 17o [Chromobacterium violaceum]
MSIETILYRTQATVSGGREGNAESSDGALKVRLSTPRELGGAGGPGTNPEQLFAAGYAACFLGSLKFVAAKRKTTLSADASVSCGVGIGTLPSGFGLEVELQIHLPGLSDEEARQLIEQAHIVCPYSDATRGNIDVRLRLA